jgi:hypothetical protein
MRTLCLALYLGLVATPAHAEEEPDSTTAALMSLFFPGAGEWYNRDYQGTVPIAEFCVGAICCPVWFSSIVDAGRGETNDDMRLDFWSSSDTPWEPLDEGGKLK